MNFIDHPPNDVAEWAQSAGATQVLLRSRIEIANMLQSALDADITLVAYLEKIDRLFMTRLLRIEPEQGHAVMSYGEEKAANEALLAAGKGLLLSYNYKNSRVEFMVEHATECFEHGPAIRFDFPDALFIRQRRSHQRISVIPNVPLACLADSTGIMPFYAEIVDIGIGGLGAMFYADDIKLAPGTILKGCKITLPDLAVATVDIVVRHVSRKATFAGRIGYRAACSFIGTEKTVAKLIEVFLLDLEKRDAPAV